MTRRYGSTPRGMMRPCRRLLLTRSASTSTGAAPSRASSNKTWPRSVQPHRPRPTTPMEMGYPMSTPQLTERSDAVSAPNKGQHSESVRLAEEVAEAEAIVATQDSLALVERKSSRERRAEQRTARHQRDRQRR